MYLVGPVTGQGYEQVSARLSSQVAALKRLGYAVLHPMMGKEYLRNEIEFRAHGYELWPASTNHAIFERDKWMVGQCDIVLADFSQSGDRTSIGSCFELAWAAWLGKHTIVVLPEQNVHRHAFVLEAADIVFQRTDEVMEYLRKLAGNE